MAAMVRNVGTDDRLDDLNHSQAVRLEMRTEFAAIRSEMTTMRTETNSQFAAQHRARMRVLGGMIVATNVIGFLGVIATILIRV